MHGIGSNEETWRSHRATAMRILGVFTLIAVTALAAIGITGCAAEAGATTAPLATVGQPPNTVTAIGTAEIFSRPDLAVTRFGVSKTENTANQALTAAAKASKAVTAAIREAGVDEKDIQTTDVMVNPEYDYSGRAPELTGYQASVSIKVTIRELEDVGSVFDAAIAAGANQSGGLTYEMSPENPARNEALANAVEDARGRAETMAEAAGGKIGDVTIISEAVEQTSIDTWSKRARHPADNYAYAESADLAVDAGQVSTMAEVTVSFKLK